MDSAEPPRIVVEATPLCGDRARAEAVLRRSLASAAAPGHSWVVTMAVEAGGVPALRAAGEIRDGSGARVAHRVVSDAAGDCSALARAVGVWASLVLDAELQRSRSGAPPPGERHGEGESHPPPLPAPDVQPVEPVWPPPAPTERRLPEADWYLHHDEAASREIGLGTFLMTGTGAEAIAGITPFAVLEVGHGIFLRPAIMVGESIAVVVSHSSDARSTWAAGRLDACLRLPGLYASRRGMQLDLCGGAEAGISYFPAGSEPEAPPQDQSLPYVNVGPSLGLRAEFGGDFAVALRGATGVNLVSSGYSDVTGNRVDIPALAGRIEVALSWRLK